MRETIRLLANGNASVAEKFKRANALWKELLVDIDTVSVEALATRLTNMQGQFENDFGSVRSHGQEAMAWVGFSLLFADLNDTEFVVYLNRGTKLLEAFRHSYCSGEVKVDVEFAARYHFIDNPS